MLTSGVEFGRRRRSLRRWRLCGLTAGTTWWLHGFLKILPRLFGLSCLARRSLWHRNELEPYECGMIASNQLNPLEDPESAISPRILLRIGGLRVKPDV
jgi:hypothetical protein